MFTQMDLFLATYDDLEEQEKREQERRKKAEMLEKLEKARLERLDFLTKNLTPRQHRLVNYLKDNFETGKYFTIEEICAAELGYELNTNPKAHDKCVALGNDIRQINWAIASRYSIIVKDKKGSCKLCESKIEFDKWKQGELAPLERKWKYLNTLEYKADRDGTMPLINLRDRALTDKEYDFVDVYKGEKKK